MSILDSRLKHIIREQLSLLVDESGKKDLILANIERAWEAEQPAYLEETRLDPEDDDFLPMPCPTTLNNDGYSVDWSTPSCCPTGHPGVPGPKGVK